MIKQLLKVQLVLALMMMSIQYSNSQVEFQISLDEDVYEVSILPSITWEAPFNLTATAQVTLVVPSGGFELTDLQNVSGTWNNNTPILSPEENPGFDYFNIGLASLGTSDIEYITGQRVVLFTFRNSGECTGNLILMPDNDPFIPPNSQNINVGNQITTLGSGNTNAWSGSLNDANCDGGVIDILGCTNSDACNYDANATIDDGTCDLGNQDCPDPCNVVLGCINPEALNFDEMANCDDGSCDFVIIIPGCTDINACNYDENATEDDGTCDLGNQDCPDPCNVVLGCINPEALNFDEMANCDDGSCDFVIIIPGCTDINACNYDENATEDDGTCDLGNQDCPDPCNAILGCTDPVNCAFDPNANCDDGSCSFDPVECPEPCNAIFGCTDPEALNFDEMANCDNGSCDFVIIIPGCTDINACNYDEDATEDDGSCDLGNQDCPDPCNVVLGCINPEALNFDEMANCDDGSCDFVIIIPGCTDENACNFNPDANEDDGSCEISSCAVDIEVTIEVDNANITEGESVTFTITVSNTGEATATGLEITDILPDGLVYEASTITEGVYTLANGIWTLDELASGQSETLTITVSVPSAGEFTNTAALTALNEPDTDSTPNNGAGEDDDDSATITASPIVIDDSEIIFNLSSLENDCYSVSLTPNVSWTGNDAMTSTAQVTILFEGTGFTIEDVTSINGTWGASAIVSNPEENPNFEYINVGLTSLGTEDITYVAGQEEELFTICVSGDCAPSIQLMENGDPFSAPNSQNLNVGNQITTFGSGNLNAWAGNSPALTNVCGGNVCLTFQEALALPWLEDLISDISTDCVCDQTVRLICAGNDSYILIGPGENSNCADFFTTLYDENGNLLCNIGGIAGLTCDEYAFLLDLPSAFLYQCQSPQITEVDLCNNEEYDFILGDLVSYDIDGPNNGTTNITFGDGGLAADFLHYTPDPNYVGPDTITIRFSTLFNPQFVSSTVVLAFNVEDCGCLCTEEFNPVCGDDGITYDNACFAECAGVSWVSGECTVECQYATVGTVVDLTGLDGCGLVIELSDGSYLEPAIVPNSFTLSAGQVIEFDYEALDLATICIIGPVIEINCIREVETPCDCANIEAPVCGVDGITYGNACLADCAGVEIANEGECEIVEPGGQVLYQISETDDGCYQVSLVPSVTWEAPDNLTATAQVTLVVPLTGFELTDLNSVNGLWAVSQEIVGPIENTNNAYITIGLASLGTEDINYVAGEAEVLFTFCNAELCASSITLMESDDPFMAPNSQDINVGNQITTLGSGNVNAWVANLGSISNECPDECICPTLSAPVCGVDGNTYENACLAACAGVEVANEGACEIEPEGDIIYQISETEDECYQVALIPSVTWEAPDNLTATAQVTLVVPNTGFEISDFSSVNGMWAVSEEIVSPIENTNSTYINIGLTNLGTDDIDFVAGQEEILFTFCNAEPCVTSITLMENDDPFMAPNSQDINVGNNITTLGSGNRNAWVANLGSISNECTITISGCIDINACNYNPDATEDDGSCNYGNPACSDPCNEIFGCTNPDASNYNPEATCEDLTCIFGSGGCTDATACNYNPEATEDNGTCNFGVENCPDPCTAVEGCTDSEATNYNPLANCDDGSCFTVTIIAGCTSPTACNYNPEAEVSNGDCDFGIISCPDPCNVIYGCTDATAANYDPEATCDNGQCEDVPIATECGVLYSTRTTECGPICTGRIRVTFDEELVDGENQWYVELFGTPDLSGDPISADFSKFPPVQFKKLCSGIYSFRVTGTQGSVTDCIVEVRDINLELDCPIIIPPDPPGTVFEGETVDFEEGPCQIAYSTISTDCGACLGRIILTPNESVVDGNNQWIIELYQDGNLIEINATKDPAGALKGLCQGSYDIKIVGLAGDVEGCIQDINGIVINTNCTLEEQEEIDENNIPVEEEIIVLDTIPGSPAGACQLVNAYINTDCDSDLCNGQIFLDVDNSIYVNEENQWLIEFYNAANFAGQLIEINATKEPNETFNELCAGTYSIKIIGIAGEIAGCVQEYTELTIACASEDEEEIEEEEIEEEIEEEEEEEEEIEEEIEEPIATEETVEACTGVLEPVIICSEIAELNGYTITEATSALDGAIVIISETCIRYTPLPNFGIGTTDEVVITACDENENCVEVTATVSVAVCDGIEGGETRFSDRVSPESTSIDLDVTLSVPTVFTPNGDGINDLFEISGLNNLEFIPDHSEITIFTENGKLVYKETEIENGFYWNGQVSSSGVAMPEGAYYYTLILTNGVHKIVKTGFVELRR